jgi:hypothetical protein
MVAFATETKAQGKQGCFQGSEGIAMAIVEFEESSR